ncbi:dienelactone hydrolase family protein [Caenimonas aquaedulcis]|uniref:Dienelactone hydrolase family protein n=1 Tax=Caenimonas aquaedulcis TaxID=2793270 RepID=A0A931H2K9_9BURK|nr:dienelactone hydrolase family protein [Caenimonas aquaedulcis]MBG9387400.1 dienelactone hydrolase family protein [Caenimonas aquaedulcis]
MSEAVTTQWISLDPAAPAFQGYLALPPAGKGPGLVLFQEIFGVNSHIQAVARQYALDGFVVLAPDLFWRQQQKVQLGYEGEQRERAIAMMKQMTPADMEADIKTSVAALRARPEAAGKGVGAVGYCLGGRLAYFSAAMGLVDAAVSYYGGGIHDNLDRAKSVVCPTQFHYGEKDTGIPLEAVEKVRSAMGDRAEVFVYPGAQHGFNCWERASYDAPSAALAHGRTLGFLAQRLF